MGEHNSKFEDDDDYNDEAGIFGAVGAILRGLVDPRQQKKMHIHQQGIKRKGNVSPITTSRIAVAGVDSEESPTCPLDISSALGIGTAESDDDKECEMQESDLQATSSTTRNTSEMLTLDLDSLSDKGVSLEESKENAGNGDEFHQMPSCAPSEETPREHRKESEEQLQQEDKKVTEKRELTSYSTLRGTWALSWLQLKELLKKRLIVASRDFKGLFFQVVFPTMQILFVLSILTLSYSPAGRTLKLESKTLDKALGSTSPGILVPVQVNGAHIHSQQPLDNSPYMDVITPDVNLRGWEGDAVHTSGEASNYLLFTSKLGPDEYAETYRYASFIYNDSVTVNSTVNWGWVKENLDFLLENQAVLRTF